MGIEKFLVSIVLDKFQRSILKKHPDLSKFSAVKVDVSKHPTIAADFQGFLTVTLIDGFSERMECTKDELETYYSIVPIKKRIKDREIKSVIFVLNYVEKSIDVDIEFIDGSKTQFII